MVSRKLTFILVLILFLSYFPVQAKTELSQQSLKGILISKIKNVPRQEVRDINIEITSFNPIENGVEVYARAWDKNGEQIGFGSDGSVDIEKFIFINPPILVDDINGDIVRYWTDKSGITKTRKLRENPKEAILLALEHTISVKKEKFDGKKIIAGKIGRSTLIVYPDAGTGGTTVDGAVISYQSPEVSWNTLRSSNGTNAYPNIGSGAFIEFYVGTGDNWQDLIRSVFTLDTSPLTSNAIISSAVFSVYGTEKNQQLGETNIGLVSSNPANNNNLVASDFNIANFGTTLFASYISQANFSVSGYNNFTLNEDGLSAISKTGITKFGLRSYHDISNSEPTKAPDKKTNMIGYYADQTGTANDPKLVIEYTITTPLRQIKGIGISR